MVKNPIHQIYQKNHQKGFTLIELMISMLIALFLLSGVISAFVANQNTVTTKNSLDNTEEALRFSAATISRVVRQADSLSGTSSNSKLGVNFTGATGVKNCLGQSLAGTQTDTFTYSNNQLLCNNTPLLGDINGITFLYGVDSNSDGWVSNSEYTAAPTDWTKVISVRVRLSLTTGKTTDFTATLRNKLISKYAG